VAKLSQIAASSPSSTSDQIVGVKSGNVDSLYNISQVLNLAWTTIVPLLVNVVTNFNADPTGVIDSTTPIQNAINSLPATGGTIFFPAGIYKISSTLTIGNGTSSTDSTTAGVILFGQGGPSARGLTDPGFGGTVVLRWAGTAGTGPMILLTGPMAGWGIYNISFDGTTINSPSIGLGLKSVSYGRCENTSYFGCSKESIILNTFDPGTWPATDHGNSMHNTFINTAIIVPGVTGAVGIGLDGGSTGTVTTNTAFNTFINTTVVLNSGTNYAYYLRVCDTNQFINSHLISGGGSAGTAVAFDYSINNQFPNDNHFFSINIDGSINTAWSNVSTTPNTGVPVIINEAYGVGLANGSALPAIPGLAVIGSQQVGYTGSGVGIGGAVTQITSIVTAVTINTICGTITTVSNAFVTGTLEFFRVNNTQFTPTDTVVLTIKGVTTGDYFALPTQSQAGAFGITIYPLNGQTEAVAINFAIIKSVST
jgi:hypothetical protein